MDRKQKKFVLVTGAMLLTFLLYKLGLKRYALTETQFKRLQTTGGISSPLRGKLRVTSPFGWRKNPITGQSQFHNGVDLVFKDGKTEGQPVYAPIAGVVSKNWFDSKGGNSIVIDSGFAKFGFAHLQSASPYPVDTIIQRGQLIGYVGNTGTSTGSHLHLTLRLNDAVVDPLKNVPAIIQQI